SPSACRKASPYVPEGSNATTSFRSALTCFRTPTNVGISQGFLTRQGRSNAPTAQRQITNRSNFPTSIPTVAPKPSFPWATCAQFTSLTRVARYALLLMGMPSCKCGGETSTVSLLPPIQASPLLFL